MKKHSRSSQQQSELLLFPSTQDFKPGDTVRCNCAHLPDVYTILDINATAFHYPIAYLHGGPAGSWAGLAFLTKVS